MPTKLLITRVEDDELTRYYSKWVEKRIKPEAENKGFRVIDLHMKKATRNQVESVLKDANPRLVLFHGHGNYDEIDGHMFEPIIIFNHNTHLLKDKVVHSFSCASAKNLGNEAVNVHGATTFIGYKEIFIALTDDYSATRPFDEIARPFLEPDMKINEALIKGNTTGEAFKKSRDIYAFWIAYYRAHGDLRDASDILSYLSSNMNSQVILGKTDESVLPS